MLLSLLYYDIVFVYMLSSICFRVSPWYIIIVLSLIPLCHCSCIRPVSRFSFNFSLACSAMIAQFTYFAVSLPSIKWSFWSLPMISVCCLLSHVLPGWRYNLHYQSGGIIFTYYKSGGIIFMYYQRRGIIFTCYQSGGIIFMYYQSGEIIFMYYQSGGIIFMYYQSGEIIFMYLPEWGDNLHVLPEWRYNLHVLTRVGR